MKFSVVVSDLAIGLTSSGTNVVEEVCLELSAGEVLALVGESASGKTTVATSLLGFQRRGASVSSGTVEISGVDVLSAKAEDLRRLRGSEVSYVPQDPGSALNPGIRIGRQVREVLDEHNVGEPRDRPARVVELMKEVSLPSSSSFLQRYPHQLSGGQQQRILLAMAFACRPRVIVLDEPTTALDVSTQAHVLTTVRRLAKTYSVAALYVTHDLSVVANIADRIAVMYAGKVVELGTNEEVFTSPRHPYTRRLLAASPAIGQRHLYGIPGTAPRPGQRPSGCAFANRCDLVEDACRQGETLLTSLTESHSVRCRRANEWRIAPFVAPEPKVSTGDSEPPSGAVLRVEGVRAGYGSTEVLHDVSISLKGGTCLAVVGESGSGKTTLARSIAGLHSGYINGSITLDEAPLQPKPRQRSLEQRRAIQYIFQNPYGSLHPRKRIAQILREPLVNLMRQSRRDADAELHRLVTLVKLDDSVLSRYPEELSGGERQRVAIARGLAVNPSVLICDEVTSALDVSVQAAIVELLADLKDRLGVGILFVTHNLPLVGSLADEVIVMQAGRIIEQGTTDQVLGSPQSTYTKQLLADTPAIPEEYLVRAETLTSPQQT